MRGRRLWRVVAVLFLAGGVVADELSREEREGRELAQQLREQRPMQDASTPGVLKIFEGRRKQADVPIRWSVIAAPTHWQTIYETLPGTNGAPVERLVITHDGLRPGRYEFTAEGFAGLPPEQQLILPFAGSDFWLMDLGLEFLHWPEQRLLRKEIKRGQSCAVLESRNPAAPASGYARVVSWVHLETGGLVQAEAYDANRKLVKEFAPKNMRKVDGRWELEEIQIRNPRASTRTRLEFQLESK
jgi:hypothetical protein